MSPRHALLFLLLTTLPCRAQGVQADSAPPGLDALGQAVLRYIRPFTADLDDTAWKASWADLNGDDVSDALVYVSGPDWCGSGGCTLLVFEAVTGPDADVLGAFHPAAEISLVHGSVLVSTERADGWCDLVVRDSDEALRVLRFDGDTYPGSPAAGLPIAEEPDGAFVFAESR